MNVKGIAAAATGLCMIWGAAHAGTDGLLAQAQPPAAIAGDVPEGTGATGSDVIILELGPAHSAEDMAAMQLLLLQLLLLQSGGGAGPDMPIMDRTAPAGTGI
jgi:hypothetical protein